MSHAGQFAMGAALSMAEALRESLHLPTLKTITEQLSFAEQMSKKNEAGGGGRGRAESLSHTSSAENREANGESDALRELWNFDSARFRGVIMLQLLVSFVVVAGEYEASACPGRSADKTALGGGGVCDLRRIWGGGHTQLGCRRWASSCCPRSSAGSCSRPSRSACCLS